MEKRKNWREMGRRKKEVPGREGSKRGRKERNAVGFRREKNA